MDRSRIQHIGGVLLRQGMHAVRSPARLALRQYARGKSRERQNRKGRRRVFILLASAWGVGGTIRATHNLAAHLSKTYDVEILSVIRRVDQPFFEFPPGVRVTALDDQRPGATPRRQRLLRGVLVRLRSALMHPADRAADTCNLWVDVQLVRRLRGRSGFLIGTRPGFNLIAADLSPPGLITIGQEHMHLTSHSRPLRHAVRRRYRKLDAVAVLTDNDEREYGEFLDKSVRLVHIPNAAELGGPPADLESRTILAAGRLTRQKGFDMLIPAFGRVARAHPDWRLRICGRGHLRSDLERLVEEQGLSDAVELPGPRDLAEEMAHASIFVLSSRFEGFPVVLLEAMSKGMAVVSFDCPTGPAEVVDDHRNGILVPPLQEEALAAAMLELVEHPDLRRRCAAAAVETAQDYRMESIGPRWEEFLAELEQSRSPRPVADLAAGLER
jgi:glycosyltransferase involved in cell wall biosynthesis